MASENVEKIKVFLKDGYKIISIKFSLENANTEEQTERVEIKFSSSLISPSLNPSSNTPHYSPYH